MEDRNVFGITKTEQTPTSLSISQSNKMGLSPAVLSEIIAKPDRKTNKQIKAMVKDAALTAVHEQCATLLAKTALENVVGLSMLEAQYTSMMPYAAARCKTLLDFYTSFVIKRMEKW